MIISWRLGPYEVRSVPRHDDPLSRRHIIFRNGTRLGEQFRLPSICDAERHEKNHAKSATRRGST